MLMYKQRRPAIRTLRAWAISVLQEAGFARSAPLNLSLLLFAVLVLTGTLLAWPLGARWRVISDAKKAPPKRGLTG